MKKGHIILIFSILALLLCGGMFYFYQSLQKEKRNSESLSELAEIDKKEMEKEYEEFTMQYDELKKTISDDSLLIRLDEEQKRAEDLLSELKRVKKNDAAEITRLKKELATVRAVLRTYIMQVDSLQRINTALADENQQVRARYSEATTQISNLNTEKESLSEKVAIASKLNATAITLSQLNKRGKEAKRIKDVTKFVVRFTLSRNVTAATGLRTVYVRMLKPTGDILNSSGSFSYEGKTLQCSAQKAVEYNGEEQQVTLYIPAEEYLGTGAYRVDIFEEGEHIGSVSKTISK